MSPTLQVVSGIATVIYAKRVTDHHKELAKFKVKVEQGSVSYTSLDEKGISSSVLNAVKPTLDVMVRSFREGVMMSTKSFHWVIQEDLDEAKKHFEAVGIANSKVGEKLRLNLLHEKMIYKIKE
jgi:hypothetical protein